MSYQPFFQFSHHKFKKVQDYLINILLSALSNTFQCDVTLYQYRGNVILAHKLKPGRVESIENIDLFYHNKHYELVLTLVHTNERYSSEVDDENIHPECDSIYKNETFAPSVYQKQCPKCTGEICLISMKTNTYQYSLSKCKH